MIVLLERGPKEVAMLTGFGEGSTIGRSSGVGLQAEGTACAIVGDSVARSPHPRTGSRYRRCTGDLSHARRRRAFLPHWEQGSVSCKHCGDGCSRAFFGRVTCFASPRLTCASVGGWWWTG